MKGRHHLLLAILSLALFLYFTRFPATILSMLAFCIGSILPDADSKDRGSFIFHTKLSFIAYAANLLEYPVSFLLGRRRGHRGALHTFSGIFLTSLAIGLPFAYLLNDSTILFGLFFGQSFHLITDINFGWVPRIR